MSAVGAEITTNAYVFVTAQFLSRFVNTFLQTAVVYELLETGGVGQFAMAQVGNNLARVVLAQVSGVLSDLYNLRVLYIGVELLNAALVVVLLPSALGVWGPPAPIWLLSVNVGLGFSQAFGMPVARSMPPAVVSTPSALVFVNSWDITTDKVAKYMAPLACSVVVSAGGYRGATWAAAVMYACLLACKQCVEVNDVTTSKGSATTASGLFRQVRDGIRAVMQDSTMATLVGNTLVTNALIYPLSFVVFPVVFRRLPEVAAATPAARVLSWAQSVLGIRKDKAWMNHAALVSMGGALGPLASGVVVEAVRLRVTGPAQSYVGVIIGVLGQIVCGMAVMMVMACAQIIDPALVVGALFVGWAGVIASNNVFTIFFNSHSQVALDRSVRGKFIGNLVTLFNLSNSCGTAAFGRALEDDSGGEIWWCVALVLLGVVARLGVAAQLWVGPARQVMGRAAGAPLPIAVVEQVTAALHSPPKNRSKARLLVVGVVVAVLGAVLSRSPRLWYRF